MMSSRASTWTLTVEKVEKRLADVQGQLLLGSRAEAWAHLMRCEAWVNV